MIIDLLARQVAAMTPHLSQYERVKKMPCYEDEFTVDGGELTPTLKVKRRVVEQNIAPRLTRYILRPDF